MPINYMFPSWNTKEDKDLVLKIVLKSIKEPGLALLDYKNGAKNIKSGDAIELLAKLRFLIGFAKALEYAKPEELNREIFDKISHAAVLMDEFNFEGLVGEMMKAMAKPKK